MAEQAPKVSKPFLVIAGVGLLLIVGFLAFRVLGGGGGGDDSSSDTAASTASTVAPGAPAGSTTTTTAPAEPTTPNQSFDVFTTKNPFQPLVTDTASTASPGDSTGEPTPPPVEPSTGVTPPPTIPAEQAPSASTPVALLEVFDENGVIFARVQVGSDVFKVQAGETFAVSYRVVTLDLAAQSGQFQYGDTPFSLGVGQQTLK